MRGGARALAAAQPPNSTASLTRRGQDALPCTRLATAIAVEREVEGDVYLGDAGQGTCFRPGTFDGVIR